MRRTKYAGIIGACLVLWTGPAAASTFVAQSLPKMVAGAKAIVQGRVLAVESFWDAGRIVIVSEALIEVEELLVGDAPSLVVVRTWGGVVGDYAVEAIGFPKFSPGQRVLVFLTTEGEETVARVLGYQQGQFRIVHGPDGQELAVPALDAGAILLDGAGRTVSPPREPVRLDELKAEILALADFVRPRRPLTH